MNCLSHILIFFSTFVHESGIFLKGWGGGAVGVLRNSGSRVRGLCSVTLLCEFIKFKFFGVPKPPYPHPNIWIRS